MAEEIGFENGRNSNFQGLVTLTLTLDPVIRHTVVHHLSTDLYLHTKFHSNRRNFLWTDRRTDVRTDIFPPIILLGRLLEVDLKTSIMREARKHSYRQLYNWMSLIKSKKLCAWRHSIPPPPASWQIISSQLFARWHPSRHVGYLTHKQQVDLWPFDLESGDRVTGDVGYLCANFSLHRSLCSRLRPRYTRQTDVSQKHRLIHPPYGAEA